MSVVGVESPYLQKSDPQWVAFFLCDVGEFPIC